MLFGFGAAVARRAASHVATFRRARTQREMGVKVRRVVMQSVSETDGIARMKFLGEFPHDFLQAGMQKVVGIDRRLK